MMNHYSLIKHHSKIKHKQKSINHITHRRVCGGKQSIRTGGKTNVHALEDLSY